MAVDVQFGNTTIATATESPISAITGDSFTVKTGRGKAKLLGASFVSANAVYGRLLGSDIHSGGIYVPASQASDVKQLWGLLNNPLPEGSIVIPYGYQNSGTNQAVVCGIVYGYDGQYPVATREMIAGKRITGIRVSATSGSGVPAVLGAINTNLSADKQYAVLGIYGVGANLRGLYITAPELNGMRAGMPVANTGVGDAGVVDFLAMNECPIISGRSPAYVGSYSLTAETTEAVVFMAEL